MSTIVTRTGKGSALTWEEADANLTNLNIDKLESGFPASDVANTPTGSIVATNVQTALNELDTEKVAYTRLNDSDGSSLVGFLQVGTGALARNVQSKLRESVSVKDFGAKGDGVADDTAAIQAAIDHASTVSGTVVIPAGNYRTGDLHINYVSGVTIKGAGTGYSVPGSPGSQLTYIGTGNCITIDDEVAGAWHYRVYLKDFNIHFEQNANAGVYAHNLNESVFDNVGVYADTKTVQSGFDIAGSNIIYLNKCTTSNTIRGIKLESGVAPNTQSNFGVYITQCNLWNHTNSIMLGNSHGINIYGNWIEGFQNAIYVNNLADTVTGLEILGLSINDNVIVQSISGHTEARAVRFINYATQEGFYVKGVINNNYIRMDAGGATRPTYAISVDMSGAVTPIDINLTINDNVVFGVDGSMCFADSYYTCITEYNNKVVQTYGGTVQIPSYSGPFMHIGETYTLIQNGASITAPLDGNQNTLFTVNIPGALIGKSGSIRVRSSWVCDSNVSINWVRIRIGGVNGFILMEKNVANCTKVVADTNFHNVNSKAIGNAFSSIVSDVGTSVHMAPTALDVSGNYELIFQVHKSVPSVAILLNSFIVEILP